MTVRQSIAAVLKAGRQAVGETGGRIFAIVQPHRFTRVHDLFEEFCTCFDDADAVYVADIYAAGETPIGGVSKEALVNGIKAHGHRHVDTLNSSGALAPLLAELVKSGDFVICLGAGSITYWAHDLPKQLEASMGNGQKVA